ncbi:MAG: 23S rRNA (guanosine(2251)-2'-O)-methyltransferase RlmB [Clostridia bacterium]|nr:23S rRNA (guanosine(2251)-2'-O)-methyltransferase RlmB [Clostridia bacterium]
MIIEGRNAVREAIQGGATIDRIIVIKGYTDNTISMLVAKAKQNNLRVDYAEKNVLERFSVDGHHQGIIAFTSDFEYCEVEDIIMSAKEKNKPHFIVLLDGIEDPHNLGSIIRACECLGVDGIIIGRHRAASVNETVVKTSAGATQYVKIARVVNINDTIRELKEAFIKVVAVDMDGEPISKSNLDGDIALIIGGEGEGIKRLTKDLADSVVSIPMSGKISSMNASVAAGIALYECRRQRG